MEAWYLACASELPRARFFLLALLSRVLGRFADARIPLAIVLPRAPQADVDDVGIHGELIHSPFGIGDQTHRHQTLDGIQDVGVGVGVSSVLFLHTTHNLVQRNEGCRLGQPLENIQNGIQPLLNIVYDLDSTVLGPQNSSIRTIERH